MRPSPRLLTLSLAVVALAVPPSTMAQPRRLPLEPCIIPGVEEKVQCGVHRGTCIAVSNIGADTLSNVFRTKYTAA